MKLGDVVSSIEINIVKLTDYALLMCVVGFGLRMVGKTERLRNLGEIILGFGILFSQGNFFIPFDCLFQYFPLSNSRGSEKLRMYKLM